MKLIVFDMDGTLIDTETLIAEHMAAAFTGAGLTAPTAAQSRRVIGLSLPLAMARLAGTDEPVLIDALVDSYKRNYRSSLENEAGREPLFPGAREALDRLRGQAGTKMGIATGKGLTGVHRILGMHGLADHFVTLQTPDHNPSKPHPGMLLRAMEETGAEPHEVVMIGDTVFDIELANAAGVSSIGVRWGYHAPDELVAAGAKVMLDRYDDLDAAIAQILE
ncbi:MAG TPA: HAD-IA family hydrolase [Devosiaceae bacterium]|jgi:phosphoglycolate phosphatase